MHISIELFCWIFFEIHCYFHFDALSTFDTNLIYEENDEKFFHFDSGDSEKVVTKNMRVRLPEPQW